MRIQDIDPKRMVIVVRQAKGGKDIMVMPGEKTLTLLREYYKPCKPNYWIFEVPHGQQYSTRSVQEVIPQAKKKAGINKKSSIHVLRHSIATHLLQGGGDLFVLKICLIMLVCEQLQFMLMKVKNT